jgi:hypothetical protein
MILSPKKISYIVEFFIEKRLYFLASIFIFFSFNKGLQAQVDVSSKEEIRITSNFRPSISKKGKVFFYATPPERDSTAFKFKYDLPLVRAKTAVKPFTINPLNMQRQVGMADSSGLYAKVGYGSLQSPYAHFSFEDDKVNRTISVWGKLISAKGSFTDQQFSNSSIGASIDSRLNENQKLIVDIGYDLDQFRQYGFDHSLFDFSSNQLNQQFNHFNTSISFSSVGKDGRTIILPSLTFNNTSTSRKANETEISFIIPFTKQFSESAFLKSRPMLDLVFFNNASDSSKLTNLFQLPLTGGFKNIDFSVEGGFNTILWNAGAKLLPTLDLHYKPNNSTLDLFIAIANKATVNSLYSLTTQNPFIVTPDSLSIFQQIDYGAGIKITLEKRFSIKVNGGYTSFVNLPLYLNTGVSGKDIKVFFQPNLNAIHLKAELAYSPTSKFDFKANVISYSFSGKSKGEKAYGFIPTEFSTDFIWKPTNNLKLNSIIKIWKGPWAFSELKLDHRLKNVADINLGVDYDFNKKWGIWIDLNNIANVKYERWSQYASFGFNIVGGIRFNLFNKKVIN